MTHARISDGNQKILQANFVFIERAIQLKPENGMYIAERGYLLRLSKDYDEAISVYKEALKVDESNEQALLGLIYCQIKTGKLEDAKQQMEFLSVIQESNGDSGAEIMFLEALLALERHKNKAKQVQLLQDSVRVHMDNLKATVQVRIILIDTGRLDLMLM